MNTRSTKKIVMLLCTLFVSANVFFSCSGQQAKEQLEKVEKEKMELQTRFDSIMLNYEKVKSENSLYAEQFSEKDSVIAAQAARINGLLAEMSSNGTGTPTRASKLRQQIKVAIEETKAANEKLASENQTLEQKIANAKRLVTSELTATAMRKKCGGKGLKITKHSNKLEVVKIEARILANDVVDPGTKTIYARITGPNNRVLCNGTAEEFSFDIDGSPMQYTAKQDIEFDGSARKVIINWSKNDNVNVIKGTYRVTLYADGQEIGKTSFKLTK